MAELAQSDPFYAFLRTFVRYFIAFCSRLEADSVVMSGEFVEPIVSDKQVMFGGPRPNRSREIPPKSVGGGSFDGF